MDQPMHLVPSPSRSLSLALVSVFVCLYLVPYSIYLYVPKWDLIQSIVGHILAFVLMATHLNQIKSLVRRPEIFFFVFYFIFINFSKYMNIILPGRAENGAILPTGIAISLFFIVISTLSLDDIRLVFKRVRLWVVLTNIPSLIVYFMITLRHDPGFQVVQIQDYTTPFRLYFGLLPFNSHTIFDLSGWSFVRLNGIYFEPGFMGTLAAFLIIASHCVQLKKGPAYVLLWAFGIASSSVAFAMIVCLFLALTFVQTFLTLLFRDDESILRRFLSQSVVMFAALVALVGVNILVSQSHSSAVHQSFFRNGIDLSRDGAIFAFFDYLKSANFLDILFGLPQYAGTRNTIVNLTQIYGLLPLLAAIGFLTWMYVIKGFVLAGSTKWPYAFALLIASYQSIFPFYHPVALLLGVAVAGNAWNLERVKFSATSKPVDQIDLHRLNVSVP